MSYKKNWFSALVLTLFLLGGTEVIGSFGASTALLSAGSMFKKDGKSIAQHIDAQNKDLKTATGPTNTQGHNANQINATSNVGSSLDKRGQNAVMENSKDECGEVKVASNPKQQPRESLVGDSSEGKGKGRETGAEINKKFEEIQGKIIRADSGGLAGDLCKGEGQCASGASFAEISGPSRSLVFASLSKGFIDIYQNTEGQNLQKRMSREGKMLERRNKVLNTAQTQNCQIRTALEKIANKPILEA